MANAGIPSVLIAPLRVALQSQGFPPSMVRDDGTLNAAGLLATAYDEIEFRSGLWPNIKLNTNVLLKDPRPSPFMSWLQPTVILRGRGNETVIAPFGKSPGGTVIPVAGAVVLLVGLGYVLAKL